MDKKTEKSFFIVWAAVAAVIVFCCIHMFVGNPLSHVLAGITLQNYVDENYPGCYFEEHSYDFTCNGYTAVVYSHTNPDIRIVVHTDTFGFTVTDDNYYEAVLQGENTSNRLNNEYTEVIKSILGDEICGYKIYSAFGRFADNFVTGEQYALKSGPLVPGGEYDIYEISPTDGDIILRVIAPGATDATAEEILLTVKQRLEDGGIVFDTNSLSIGEDSDCWPYIMDIEKIPYSTFAEPDFGGKMEAMAVYSNPEWALAFGAVTDRYIKMIQSVDWTKAENFRYRGIQVGFYLTPDCARHAYGYTMFTSENGLEQTDIDAHNYGSYTDEYIAQLGEKAGHIYFNVYSDEQSHRTAAEIINEINMLMKQSGLEYAVAEIDITKQDFSNLYHYKDIPYSESEITREEIQQYYQQ